ncbi:MAG: hypothetical protein WB662_08435 [Methyloceanibacter sp.]
MTINTHSATRAHGLLPKRVIDLSRASRSDIILEIAACMIDAGHGARHVARFRGESAIYDMDELQALGRSLGAVFVRRRRARVGALRNCLRRSRVAG